MKKAWRYIACICGAGALLFLFTGAVGLLSYYGIITKIHPSGSLSDLEVFGYSCLGMLLASGLVLLFAYIAEYGIDL